MADEVDSIPSDVILNGVLGIVLLLFNVPILTAILWSSTLRLRYAVLAALLLPCSLNGVQCLGHVFMRLIVMDDPDTLNRSRSALSCISDPAILLDQFTFTAVPIMLMMVSVDRWLVVTYPLQYYYHSTKYVVIQIIPAYIFVFVLQAITIAWTGLYNIGVLVCINSNYMPAELYIFLIMIRLIAAALSIVFMLIVLVKLKLHIETTSQYRSDAQLRMFMRRQRSFTNAMLISCGFTFVFFVIPTCISLYGRFVYRDSGMFARYTRFITFFNSLNMVIVIVLRTAEIKQRLQRIFCRF